MIVHNEVFPAPHRRLRLVLDLEADDIREVVLALENISRDLAIDAKETREVTSGGYRSGYQLWLTCNPDMTGDKYREQLMGWSRRDREHVGD